MAIRRIYVYKLIISLDSTAFYRTLHKYRYFFQKLCVCTFLCNPLLRKHYNPVCIFLIVDSLCAITKVVRFLANFSKLSCTTLSLSLSRAEVASSNIRIEGFFFKKYTCDAYALLLTARKLYTPLSDIGIVATRKLHYKFMGICVFLAAFTISSSVAPGFPYKMFSLIVPANKYTSCCTIPIW